MTGRPIAVLVCLLAIAPGLALGQSPDAAAERARLANERIQAEAERQAREELERQSRAAASAPPPATARPEPVPSQPASGPAASARPPAVEDRTGRGLEQLRELGRLKDAGYLTDAEFQRIKQRILDSHF
jgi:hypothetical protein